MSIIELLIQNLETVKKFVTEYKGDYRMQYIFTSQAFGAVDFAQQICREQGRYDDCQEIGQIYKKYQAEYQAIIAEG